ncbi:MAG: ammonium transporter [Candidatus Bathyarchaeia archaeon]
MIKLDADIVWVSVSIAFVVLMVPALGIFYAGLVRRKNQIATFFHCLAVFAVVGLVWALVGYSLVFGPSIGGFIGDLSKAGLLNVGSTPNQSYAPGIPETLFLVFQCVVAAITPALIIGALVERTRLRSMLLFSILWSLFIYSPIAHWVWNTGGWLHVMGVIDFAGGYAVHTAAGVSALAAAIVIGRRLGLKKGEVFKPSSIPLVILGASILWFGWFGFNAGSALKAGDVSASAVVVTFLSAAAAGLSWMIIEWRIRGKPSSVGFSVAAVCGLVAITPGSGFITVPASIIVGLASGIVSYFAANWRANKTNIDDSLDVFACHGVNGIMGSLATGLFASVLVNPAGANGLLYGNPGLFEAQLIAAIAVIAYAFVGSYILLKLINRVSKLRVEPEEENEGLDIAELGESIDE